LAGEGVEKARTQELETVRRAAKGRRRRERKKENRHDKTVFENRRLSLSLFVLFACASAHAQTVTRMRADIPFDFRIGQQTFRAGHYFVDRVGRQTAQESLRISSADGKTSALVNASPILESKANEASSLVFYRYGDMSFLTVTIPLRRR
jgi:hypothetical protein